MKKFWEYLRNLVHIHAEVDVDAASATIKKNVHFRGMNAWILACAIVIASLGLNVNSTAVIIGAMLISPLMGPIIGLGFAMGTNDLRLMKISLKNLAVMVSISLVVSALFFLVSPLNMQHPSELLARTNPTIYDVLIAFVGGLAGALETSRKDKGTVISGVAIATALMPPLCTVGYGIANLDLTFMLGAFYLFFINCTFVALATFIVVKYLGFPSAENEDERKAKRARSFAAVLLTIVIVPSFITAVKIINENNFNLKADEFVTANKNVLGDSIIYDYKTDPHAKPATITLYLAGRRLTDTDKETLFASAEKEYGIGRHQISFEAAFGSALPDGEFEKQIYTDLNTSIAELKEKLRFYESRELPYAQIDSEVRALYPQVKEFSLARGEDAVYAIVGYAQMPDESIASQLGTWLKLRVGSEKLFVIEQIIEESKTETQQ